MPDLTTAELDAIAKLKGTVDDDAFVGEFVRLTVAERDALVALAREALERREQEPLELPKTFYGKDTTPSGPYVLMEDLSPRFAAIVKAMRP